MGLGGDLLNFPQVQGLIDEIRTKKADAVKECCGGSDIMEIKKAQGWTDALEWVLDKIDEDLEEDEF